MENSIPLFIGLAALLFLSIILLLVWQVVRQRQGDRSNSMQYLNLAELRRRGLLNDAEMAQVRSALARQMEKQEQDEKRRQSALRANELILDPEIRRIELQAELARLEKMKAQEQPGADVKRAPVESLATNSATPQVNDEQVDEDLWEKPDEELAPTGLPISEMPPDVVAMFESGIITEEEFEQARRKYRQQKNMTGEG